jgi:transposase
MAKHQRKKSPAEQQLPAQRHAVNLHAAGIDVGAEAHWVAVPVEADPQPVRVFLAHTASLHALAAWLPLCGSTPVALESTGVYWIPLFELLEPQGCEVILVDPGTMPKNGRPKTDVHDGQWLQRLHTLGLLSAAFRPDDPVVVLRSYLRLRLTLLADAARAIQHMQKALTQRNIKRQHVVSDITGVTGLRIITAILHGERDPLRLAVLRDWRCKEDEATIAQALHGTWREEHLFALHQAVAAYEFCHQQIAECDAKIKAPLLTFEDHSQGECLPPRPRKRHRNRLSFETRPLLHRMTGVDLTQIEGIDETTALIVLGEIGLDMSRWPSEKHCTSWMGLCPRVRVSGGRVLSSRTRPTANRAAAAWRLAAASLHHSQSALGAFFRRMKARLGTPKAITATAHKLARLIYAMLKHGTAYVAESMDPSEQKDRQRVVNNLSRRARDLGYDLVAKREAVTQVGLG